MEEEQLSPDSPSGPATLASSRLSFVGPVSPKQSTSQLDMVHFTRDEFDQAVKEWIAAAEKDQSVLPPPLGKGWTWKEHNYLPHFGYAERRGVVRRLRQPQSQSQYDSAVEEDVVVTVIEDEDDAALPREGQEGVCRIDAYICLSPTFHVPVLYFTARRSSGAPLSLSSLLNLTLFHPSSSSSYPFSTLSPTTDEPPPPNDEPPPTPFLSQSDHPTLGTPCWFLHPCETENIVREILDNEDGRGEVKGADWMRTWAMVVGSVLDLRS